jgi:hypothetical protein
MVLNRYLVGDNKMSINTLYIPAFYFQGGILDKNTGFPLAGGIVTFYKDQARTELKPVYQISESPPNYSFTVLPNPMTLSSIGTFQDNSGNDIVPYFFPYDENGNKELYYITVDSSLLVPQFTREGEPNTSGIDINASIVTKNFIPNGQFLLHNDIESYPYTFGQIPPANALEVIAPGGWNFERTISPAVDYVIFEEFGSYVTNPTQSPRWACRCKCTTPDAGDTRKWLKIVFNDVNKFASDTQYYTLTFSAISNTSLQPIQILVYKYYGSSGTSADTVVIQNINIENGAYQTYNVPILFGNNVGKVISGNDDSVSVVIAFPPTSPYDVSLTDFSLVKGSITLVEFPITTNTQFISETLFSNLPLSNNSSIALPMIYTKSGCKFDDSQVGMFFMGSENYFTDPAPYGFVYSDGKTYDSDGFSVEGIPYSRLQLKWANSINLAKYGNGYDYVSCLAISGGYVPFNLQVHLKQGTATPAIDGALPTGFVFTNMSTDPVSTHITCNAGSAITAGAYFIFTNSAGGLYIAYYSVNGIGSKPSISGVIKFIKIEINSTDLASDVAFKTIYTINGAYLMVPDYRGMFPRFQDGGKGIDPNANTRRSSAFSGLPAATTAGDFPGTEQDDQNKSHKHLMTAQTWGSEQRNDGTGTSFYPAVSPPTNYSETQLDGGQEARSKNIYVSPLVKL